MKKLLAFALMMSSLLAASVYLGPGLYNEPVRRLLVWTLNQQTRPAFNGTLRIEKLQIARDLGVRMENMAADLQTENGTAPFEIGALTSRGSVLQLFSPDGLTFDFTGARPRGSKVQGLTGVWQIVPGPRGFSDLTADILGIHFADVTWINPDSLAGTTGFLTGSLHLRIEPEDRVIFESTLKVPPPGGEMQARFFQVFEPYLPAAARPVLLTAALSGAVVAYQEAEAQIKLTKPDELNVFLYLLVPVYNLNIRLNLTVKLDEENAFGKLARIMGLIHPAPAQ